MSEIGSKETTEVKKPEVENYKEIKPDTGMTVNEAKDFWDGKFSTMQEEGNKEEGHSKLEEEKTNEIDEKV